MPAPQPSTQTTPEESAGEAAGSVNDEAVESKGSGPSNDNARSSLANFGASTHLSTEQAVKGLQQAPQQLQQPQRIMRPPVAAPQGYFVPASQPGRPRGAHGYNNAHAMMNGAGVSTVQGGNGDILINDAHPEMPNGRSTEVGNTGDLQDVAL